MDSENIEDAAQLSSPAGSGSTDYVFQDKLTVKGNKILRVKLVGKHGKNKFRRDFSKIKWSEHLPLYVDASLNINHTEDRWRSFEGRIGWVEKPREIGGELYGLFGITVPQMQINMQLEDGKLELAASIAAYRRGMELMKHCQAQLADAEQQIRVLENGRFLDVDRAPQEVSSGDNSVEEE